MIPVSCGVYDEPPVMSAIMAFIPPFCSATVVMLARQTTMPSHVPLDAHLDRWIVAVHLAGGGDVESWVDFDEVHRHEAPVHAHEHGCSRIWQGVAGWGRLWQGVAGCGRVVRVAAAPRVRRGGQK